MRWPEAVELGLAVLLQGFAHHFSGELGFHVAQALDGVVAILELSSYFSFSDFSASCFCSSVASDILEFVAFLLDAVERVFNGELLVDLVGFQLGFECLDLGILRGCGLLKILAACHLSQLGSGLGGVLGLLQIGGQLVALLFDCGQGLSHGQLAGLFALIQLGF